MIRQGRRNNERKSQNYNKEACRTLGRNSIVDLRLSLIMMNNELSREEQLMSPSDKYLPTILNILPRCLRSLHSNFLLVKIFADLGTGGGSPQKYGFTNFSGLQV